MFNFIIWNLSPEIFKIHGFALRYYSVLFAFGFICGIWILQRIYTKEGVDQKGLNKLVLYVGIGTLAGARLGHCLFYEWTYYEHHIVEIFLPLQIRPGGHIVFTGYQGLASHGGAIGILLAILLYCRKYKVNLFWLLDRMAIVVALAGFFIRVGNLCNSEIIGTPTKVPWAFIFKRVDALPRHPAQLYEAFAYLLIFFVLSWLYKKNRGIKKAYLFSIFLITVFGVRFIIEFWKQNQELFEHSMPLNMGQLLSIPFILLGVYLQWKIRKNAAWTN